MQQGGQVSTIQLDVSDKSQVASLLEKIPKDLRDVDILGAQVGLLLNRVNANSHLVNNAGFVKGIERVGDIADADIEAMYTTNVFGLISLTQ